MSAAAAAERRSVLNAFALGTGASLARRTAAYSTSTTAKVTMTSGNSKPPRCIRDCSNDPPSSGFYLSRNGLRNVSLRVTSVTSMRTAASSGFFQAQSKTDTAASTSASGVAAVAAARSETGSARRLARGASLEVI